VLFRRAGHILGAATVELDWGGVRLVHSGDLGRYGDPIMADPEPVARADYLMIESTYGDRLHSKDNPEDVLAGIIAKTIGRGGTIVIPAFAVGRAQHLMFHLANLRQEGRIPSDLPMFLDSPMAIDASDIFARHPDDHKLSEQQCRAFGSVVKYVHTPEESKALTANPSPKIILSASGMATGGRVLHHLKQYAPDAKNSIVFAGYQAAGTRGAAMLAGAETIKIHGQYVPVRAAIHDLDMLSAHADYSETLRWLKGFAAAPRMTYIVHGEPVAADALRHRIEEELGWPVHVAEDGEKVALS
jgi:metallo-beta-lactamase family protein